MKNLYAIYMSTFECRKSFRSFGQNKNVKVREQRDLMKQKQIVKINPNSGHFNGYTN